MKPEFVQPKPRDVSQEVLMPLGQVGLITELALAIPLSAVRSYLIAGARRTNEREGITEEFYPPQYRVDSTLIEHLRFALRYEPLDLGVLYEAFQAMGEEIIRAWVQIEPTGGYSRRAWFLYETLTGKKIDLPDAKRGNYVDALDDKRQFTLPSARSVRHRVKDNLLGSNGFYVTIRRTDKLNAFIASRLGEEAKAVTEGFTPDVLARATSFLFTRETRSSFAIENEKPTPAREERFLQALHGLDRFEPTKAALISLQGAIVEPRYAVSDWRTIQNFVGETTRGFGEYVHYICPKPEYVPSLMMGWMALTKRLLSGGIDPVVAAVACSFPFVFIHPFEDGNGRTHRFLMHYLLTRLNFGPEGILLPVSAAILREKSRYDKVLEAFSRPLLSRIEWNLTSLGEVVVTGDTRDLYRFYDLTPQAEFLYEMVASSIRVDFREELRFLQVFDAALSGVLEIVDMPTRRASTLVRLCLQNGGRLAKGRHGQFPELSESEIEAMEAVIGKVIIESERS